MRSLKHWLWRFAIIISSFILVLIVYSKTIRTDDRNTVSTKSNAVCVYQDHGALPDYHCTPGAFNSAVTQRTINKTICVPGWTATIRPPVSFTEPLKFKIMRKYGITDSARNYELDHLIPLELGGSPDSEKNLWPEPHGGADGSYTKDGWENKLKHEVCNGTMKLAVARKVMKKGTWINGR